MRKRQHGSYLVIKLNDDQEIWRQVHKDEARSAGLPRIRSDLVSNLLSQLCVEVKALEQSDLSASDSEKP